MRGPKKSETLEIRLPYATKQAFAARCQGQGRSVSATLRAFIDRELDQPRRARLDANRDGQLSLQEFERGAAVQIVVGPGAARAVTSADDVLRVEFGRIDRNRHGEIALDEFRRYYAR